MPFVPLGSRKRLEVILDDDKERIISQQRARDAATVVHHTQVAPGSSGYRFANHPCTLVPDGRLRVPDPPFRGATATWRPPSADPNGPASQKISEQADVGMRHEGSNRPLAHVRKMRSSPSLMSSASSVVDPSQSPTIMGHPLAVESRRWQKIADFTEKNEMKDLEIPLPPQEAPEEKKVGVPGDLVMFPKYMLYQNCHLKGMDLKKFQQAQLAKERAFAEGIDPFTLTGASLASQDMGESVVKLGEASWGAPVLKNASGHHYAGNALPSGRCQRTSNPLVTG